MPGTVRTAFVTIPRSSIRRRGEAAVVRGGKTAGTDAVVCGDVRSMALEMRFRIEDVRLMGRVSVTGGRSVRETVGMDCNVGDWL